MKKPEDSAIESREFIMPNQLNNKNTLFGGELVSLIDKVASMCAQKHSEMDVVTASIDSLSFENPVYKNEHLILKAMVNYTGNTSMEIGVRVETENTKNLTKLHIATAYLTFVAVDDQLIPKKVPSLDPQSVESKRRWVNAEQRVQYRKSARNKAKKNTTP